MSAKEHGQFTGVFKLCCVISLYQQIMCLVEVIHNDHTAQYFHEKQASTKKGYYCRVMIHVIVIWATEMSFMGEPVHVGMADDIENYLSHQRGDT